MSEHVYRFRQALDVWRHPFWVEQATDDLDEYREFVRSTPLRLGLETDFIPGAEDRIRNMLERARTSTTSSARCTSSAMSRSITRTTTPGTRRRRDRVWRTYFEYMAEAARSASTTSSPTPTW